MVAICDLVTIWYSTRRESLVGLLGFFWVFIGFFAPCVCTSMKSVSRDEGTACLKPAQLL